MPLSVDRRMASNVGEEQNNPPLAQLVEQLPLKEMVVSSNLTGRTGKLLCLYCTKLEPISKIGE